MSLFSNLCDKKNAINIVRMTTRQIVETIVTPIVTVVAQQSKIQTIAQEI